MSNLTATRSDYGKFVAAARWLRANGWTYDRTDAFGLREWRWRGFGDSVSILATDAEPTHLFVRFDDTDISSTSISVQDAIDLLVTAGILPVELASWASPDGIAETMKAIHMVAIDLRPEWAVQ